MTKHKINRWTYARGRVRATCTCGEQTKWMPGDSPRATVRKQLIASHPRHE